MVTPEEARKCAAVYEKAAADLRLFDSSQSNNYKIAAQALRDLAAQVDELTAHNLILQDVYATAAEEVEALQADAERWRFIQNTDNFAPCKWSMVRSYDGPFEEGWEILTDAEVDAAIAARKDQP